MRFRSYKKTLSKSVIGFSPDSDWKKSSRDALLARIRQTEHWQEPEKSHSFGSIFSTMIAPAMLKPVLASLLVVSLTMTGSVFAVQAAKASLPGDTLYSVKLGIEDVQVGLVFSEKKKAELEVKFAGTRLKEVKEVIENDIQTKKQAQNSIKKAIQNFNDNLGSVQKRLEKIENEPKSEVKALEISKLVNEKTTELESDLLEIKEKIASKDALSVPVVEALDSVESENPIPESEQAISNDSEQSAIAEDQEKSAQETESQEANAQKSDVSQKEESFVSQETVNKNTGETLAQETKREGKELLDTLELALTALDDANTKSLEVFVGKAVESKNEEVKKDAVEKLQNKIEKVEKHITDTQEKIEKITEKTTTQNLGKESIEVVSEIAPTESSKEVNAQSSAVSGEKTQDPAVKKEEKDNIISSTTPEILIKTNEINKDIVKPATQSAEAPAKTEQKPIKEVIEQAQFKPNQAKETINEAKKILNEKTEQLGQAVEKLNQAKAMVKEADQNIKTVEQKIDQKSEEVKKANQDTQSAPSSIVPVKDSAQSSTSTAQIIEEPIKSS